MPECSLQSVNYPFKFADDTNLLVLEKSDTTMKQEFENVIHWARCNKMTIQISKTKDIPQTTPWQVFYPSTFENIAVATEAKLLGILLVESHKYLPKLT